jgi:hypothetical protein
VPVPAPCSAASPPRREPWLEFEVAREHYREISEVVKQSKKQFNEWGKRLKPLETRMEEELERCAGGDAPKP